MNDSETRSCIGRTGKRIAGMVALLLLAACTESALFAVNSLARTDNFALVEDIAYGRHPMNRLDMYCPVRTRRHVPRWSFSMAAAGADARPRTKSTMSSSPRP